MTPAELLGNPLHGIVTETRPLQVALAEYLHQAFTTDTPCMVEAGTGCGKSFAYLLSAIAYADDEHKVVISTAMKSLQQQLYFKDLPYLASKGHKLPYARVLGKTNYGCKRRVHLNVFDKKERAVYDEFFSSVKHWVWEDAPEALADKLPWTKHEHAVAYCNMDRCEHFQQCRERGYVAAKMEIDKAQILVVNHAVVGADMRVFNQHDVKMLGDYTRLIVDEAHKYPEAIRNALACEMPAKFFEKAEEKYGEILDQLTCDMDAVMHLSAVGVIPKKLPMFDELSKTYKAMQLDTQRTGTYGEAAHAFAKVCRVAMAQMGEQLELGTPAFRDFLLNIDGRNVPIRAISTELRRIEAAMQALYYLDGFYARLDQFANAIDMATVHSLHYVVAVETDMRGNTVIKTLPIQIDEKLAQYYHARNIIPAYLSATLTVGQSFDFFAREIGHDAWKQLDPYFDEEAGMLKTRPAPTFYAGTPFDYAKQAWCYVPYLPEPTADNYIEAVVDECYDLLMANEGHAFILFTSYKDLEAVGNGLKQKGYPYPLLMQGPLLKARGREIFLATKNATLLGTRTFWEGIDVPGLHLTLVIIPKAPFPNPGDAIVKAKSAIAGDRWFNSVSMPMMLTDLRQMAGRLIRSMDDKGIVALLDGRVHTKKYGKQMVDAVGFPWGHSKPVALKLLGQLSRKRNVINGVSV